MLRQATNEVKVEGILAETDLKYSTFMKDNRTVEAIGGSIKVLVEQVINGKDTALEIPIYLFSSKYTKTDALNPAYESIEKVMKEFTPISVCGSKENADKVRLRGNIRMNEFYGQNGQLISQPRINASFVSHAIGDFKPEASFNVEFMVSQIAREVDTQGNEVEPTKLNVTTIIPGYNGKVEVVKLTASSPNVVNAIETYWEAGKTFKANGKLNFTSSTKTVIEEVDFGDPIEKVQTVTLSEFLITGGSQYPMDENMEFALDDIKVAMAERSERLEAMKTRNKSKTAPAQNGTKGKFDLGF